MGVHIGLLGGAGGLAVWWSKVGEGIAWDQSRTGEPRVLLQPE